MLPPNIMSTQTRWSILEMPHHDTLAESQPHIHISNARMNMHPHGFAVDSEYLFQYSSCWFAGFNVGIRHKVPVGSVGGLPADFQSFGFSTSNLDENESISWNLLLYTTSKGLHAESTDEQGSLTQVDGLTPWLFRATPLGLVAVNPSVWRICSLGKCERVRVRLG
jgi:hypothetical protein